MTHSVVKGQILVVRLPPKTGWARLNWIHWNENIGSECMRLDYIALAWVRMNSDSGYKLLYSKVIVNENYIPNVLFSMRRKIQNGYCKVSVTFIPTEALLFHTMYHDYSINDVTAIAKFFIGSQFDFHEIVSPPEIMPCFFFRSGFGVLCGCQQLSCGLINANC